LKWRLLLQQQQRLQFKNWNKKKGRPPSRGFLLSVYSTAGIYQFKKRKEKKTDFFIISNRTRRRQRGLWRIKISSWINFKGQWCHTHGKATVGFSRLCLDFSLFSFFKADIAVSAPCCMYHPGPAISI
jgi:hypothetical protein